MVQTSGRLHNVRCLLRHLSDAQRRRTDIRKTVRIFPNPGHPQQGYCGRSAGAMWIWNHPLRLRKPLKRIGEKGEGKFKEITWDEALNEIGAKVKDLVQKYGESCITTTSHNFQE